MGYSFRLAARVLLYAPSHRQDSTYHGLCYTSRGALAEQEMNKMAIHAELKFFLANFVLNYFRLKFSSGNLIWFIFKTCSIDFLVELPKQFIEFIMMQLKKKSSSSKQKSEWHQLCLKLTWFAKSVEYILSQLP